MQSATKPRGMQESFYLVIDTIGVTVYVLQGVVNCGWAVFFFSLPPFRTAETYLFIVLFRPLTLTDELHLTNFLWGGGSSFYRFPCSPIGYCTLKSRVWNCGYCMVVCPFCNRSDDLKNLYYACQCGSFWSIQELWILSSCNY